MTISVLHFKKLLTSTAALAIFAAGIPASAADLPTRKEPSPFTPTPAYSWAGFYAGINGGYGWGSQDPLGVITNRFDSASFGIQGGAIGGTVGAQLQQGHVVLGVEGDLDWANVSGSNRVVPTIGGLAQPFSVNLQSQIDWIGTGRLRVGWAQDNWLFYSTAGLAMMGAQPHLGSITSIPGGVSLSCADVAIPNCSSSGIKGGIAAGAGVEYGFTANLSGKMEYIYIGQLQGANLQNLSMVRVGLNYRFGG